LVDSLDIPVPFDLTELCRRIARDRGRPIRLIATTLPPDGPCGVWVAIRDTDYVLYEQATSPLHQEHIIMHEIGHLLCGHESGAGLGKRTTARLLPHLDPVMVARVLERTSYRADDERQAELIASLILQRAERADPATGVAPPEVGMLARLEECLLPRHRHG
jgi:hypothetical protein